RRRRRRGAPGVDALPRSDVSRVVGADHRPGAALRRMRADAGRLPDAAVGAALPAVRTAQRARALTDRPRGTTSRGASILGAPGAHTPVHRGAGSATAETPVFEEGGNGERRPGPRSTKARIRKARGRALVEQPRPRQPNGGSVCGASLARAAPPAHAG